MMDIIGLSGGKEAGAVTGPTPPRSARDHVTRIRCRRSISDSNKTR